MTYQVISYITTSASEVTTLWRYTNLFIIIIIIIIISLSATAFKIYDINYILKTSGRYTAATINPKCNINSNPKPNFFCTKNVNQK